MSLRLALCCALLLALIPVRAQPARAQTAEKRALNPQALAVLDSLVARYDALNSYADTVQLQTLTAPGQTMPRLSEWDFRATMQWERPYNFRFEGTMGKSGFLALGTKDIVRALSPEYPFHYVSRERGKPNPIEGQGDMMDNDMRLNAPSFDVQAGAPGFVFTAGAQTWKNNQRDIADLAMQPDATAEGELCRVVKMDFAVSDNNTSTMRVFIAKSDGLLRRVEQNYNDPKARFTVVETHSDVRVNPELPASTWEFKAPFGARPVVFFSQIEPDKYAPDIKVGDVSPVFSGDALDGQPLELNPKSGVVTIVHFFTLSSGIYDVQVLEKLRHAVGPDKLQIIGVSGDGVRARVQKFDDALGLGFPIYFDAAAMKNPLAQKFGIKGWPTTLIFGADGKLQTIVGRPGEVEFIKTVQKLLPGTPDDALMLPDNPITEVP